MFRLVMFNRRIKNLFVLFTEIYMHAVFLYAPNILQTQKSLPPTKKAFWTNISLGLIYTGILQFSTIYY